MPVLKGQFQLFIYLLFWWTSVEVALLMDKNPSLSFARSPGLYVFPGL